LLGKKAIFIVPMTMVFLISSSLDLMGIGLIGAYIALIISPSFLLEIQDKYLSIQYFNNSSSEEIILIVGYVLLATFVIKFIAIVFTNFLIFQFANSEQVKIQKNMISSYLNQDYEKFILSKNSDYLASVSNYSSGYKEFLMQSLQLFSSLLVIIGAFILLSVISFKVVLWVVIGLIVVMGIYNLYFVKKINKFGEEYRDGTADLIQGTQEAAGGMKEIKTIGAEALFIDTVSEAAEKIARGQIGLNIATILPRNMLEVFLISFIVAMITKDIYLNQDLASTIILMGTFAAAMIRIVPLISQLQISVNSINYQQSSVVKLAKMIRDNGINLNEHLEESRNQSFERSAVGTESHFEQLKLENLSYAYPESSKMSIKSVNLEINKGDFVGIIGPSGSGKTTLVDIILGFLKPTNGFIKFNHEDAHKDIKKLLRLCAYLPQDIFLINGTIKENITMQSPNISDESLIGIIKSSNLDEFLHDLPDGLDTHVGDRGVRLSGGQKQRVAIARALYFEREILIMDESTSALDTKTEEVLMSELTKLKNKTIISIAHRVSTLEGCNKIYTVQSGEVKGPFTYNEIVSS
jgi:ABC-type multidrug transport system fused ATPase/permease subunit